MTEETFIERLARVLADGCKRHDSMTDEQYTCEGRSYTTLQIILGAIECACDSAVDDYDASPVDELRVALSPYHQK